MICEVIESNLVHVLFLAYKYCRQKKLDIIEVSSGVHRYVMTRSQTAVKVACSMAYIDQSRKRKKEEI